MRNYSAEEVMQYVSEMEVKFIRLAFCDIFGRQKNIAILPSELPKAFSTGIAFDASAIAGFGGAVRSDLFLHPDPTTLVALPWRPEIGSVVRMFCQVTYPDGTPLPSDSRAILKKAVAEAEAKGYSFASAPRWSSTCSRPMSTATPPRNPTTVPVTWTSLRRTRARTSGGRSA